MSNLMFAAIGFGAALVLYLGGRLLLGKGLRGRQTSFLISIEKFKAIGELSVFKVIAKEIATSIEHWAGGWKKYLGWLASASKIVMIFEFNIDFRYNLRSQEFEITPSGDGSVHIKMPPCRYDINIKDVKFYDEQKSKLLPWLLPGLVNQAFSGGFDEEDKNRLIANAKDEATRLAERLVENLRSEVESSARETLRAIARGFGCDDVEIEFRRPAPEAAQVTYGAAEKALPAPSEAE